MKQITFFSKIETRETALKTLKDAAYGFFFVATLQAIIGMFLLKQYSMLLDSFLYVVLGLLVWRLKSRVAAVLLLLITLISFGVTCANKLGYYTVGGNNIILAIVMVWVAGKAVEATFKLHGRFDQSEPLSLKEKAKA